MKKKKKEAKETKTNEVGEEARQASKLCSAVKKSSREAKNSGDFLACFAGLCVWAVLRRYQSS